MRNSGRLLIVVALAVAGMSAFWDDVIAAVPALAPYRILVVAVGVFSFFGGLGLILFSYFGRIVQYVQDRFFGHWVYDCRKASAEDAKYIDDLSTRRIGPNTSDIDAIRRLIALDIKTVFLVYCTVRIANTRKEVRAGYFIVYPLSTNGVGALLDGTFNAPNPARNHLSARPECTAIYIGGIASERGKAQNRCMSLMLGALRSDDFASAKTVYARAGTEVGKKHLEIRDFVAIDPNREGVGALYQRAIRP